MTPAVITAKQYVEQRDDGYWIIGSRISLDSIVYTFLEGKSPESIVQSFPILTLEQVYGAIAFYLANRAALDAYLADSEVAFAHMQLRLEAANPLLYQKLRELSTPSTTIKL